VARSSQLVIILKCRLDVSLYATPNFAIPLRSQTKNVLSPTKRKVGVRLSAISYITIHGVKALGESRLTRQAQKGMSTDAAKCGFRVDRQTRQVEVQNCAIITIHNNRSDKEITSKKAR